MRQKKLLISALTLVFAVIAVVSTTYAWFTMNTVNTVSDLNFTATSGEGLYMNIHKSASGWNDSTWVTELKGANFAGANEDNIGFDSDFVLKPVTLILDDPQTLAFENTASSGDVDGYVQFEIAFRSLNPMTVSIDTMTLVSMTA